MACRIIMAADPTTDMKKSYGYVLHQRVKELKVLDRYQWNKLIPRKQSDHRKITLPHLSYVVLTSFSRLFLVAFRSICHIKSTRLNWNPEILVNNLSIKTSSVLILLCKISMDNVTLNTIELVSIVVWETTVITLLRIWKLSLYALALRFSHHEVFADAARIYIK